MTEIIAIIGELADLLADIHILVAGFAKSAESRDTASLAGQQGSISKGIDSALSKVAMIPERVRKTCSDNGISESQGIGKQVVDLANASQSRLTDVLQTFKIRTASIISDFGKGVYPDMQIEELKRLSVMSERLLATRIEYLLKELVQADQKLSVGSRTMTAVK